MTRLPPLNAVKAFEAVVRLGNCTTAAAELGVTHGAVSRQLRILEQYFGCKLFRSHGRQLIPTEIARYYAAESSSALVRIAMATQRVKEPAAARLVRLSALPSLVTQWIMPRLKEFQKLHPNIELNVAASRDPLDHLVTTNDVIIRRWPMEANGFDCAPLIRDFRVAVCSPDYLARRPIRDAKDVREATVLTSDGKNQSRVWERWLHAAGLDPQTNLRRIKFDHVFVMLEGAAEGLGVALLPYSLAAKLMEAGRLVEPLPDMRAPYPDVHILFPEAGRRSGAIDTFTAFLRAEGDAFSQKGERVNGYTAQFNGEGTLVRKARGRLPVTRPGNYGKQASTAESV